MRKFYLHLPASLLLLLCQACDTSAPQLAKYRAENHQLRLRLAALGKDTTDIYDLSEIPASGGGIPSDTSTAPSTSSVLGSSGSAGETTTSIWRVGHYQDKFGEPTKKGYITTQTPIQGTFSNSATQDSELLVSLLLNSNQEANIQLYEYARNNPVKAYSPDEYEVNVKDKDGKVLNLTATNYSDRLSFEKVASKKLHNAFLKGGKLQFVIRESDTPTTIYKFALDNADGFLAARKELKGVK